MKKYAYIVEGEPVFRCWVHMHVWRPHPDTERLGYGAVMMLCSKCDKVGWRI